MNAATPILEIAGALPDSAESRIPGVPLYLRIMPGDFALIDIPDPQLAAEFADLCCGLLRIRQGSVRFLGRDWAGVPDELAAAMRGRIGRMYGPGSWVGFLGTDVNILLSQLHHTRRTEAGLRDAAAELSYRFGLPGLPLARPAAVSDADLLRAACVRAFIGEPQLVILDNGELEDITDLRSAILNAVAGLPHRQAGCVWLTNGGPIWQDRSVIVTIRRRLSEHGLLEVRSAP